jgi:hypothetical protein
MDKFSMKSSMDRAMISFLFKEMRPYSFLHITPGKNAGPIRLSYSAILAEIQSFSSPNTEFTPFII